MASKTYTYSDDTKCVNKVKNPSKNCHRLNRLIEALNIHPGFTPQIVTLTLQLDRPHINPDSFSCSRPLSPLLCCAVLRDVTLACIENTPML